MNDTIARLQAVVNRHDADGMAACSRPTTAASSPPIPTAASAVPSRWPPTGASCSKGARPDHRHDRSHDRRPDDVDGVGLARPPRRRVGLRHARRHSHGAERRGPDRLGAAVHGTGRAGRRGDRRDGPALSGRAADPRRTASRVAEGVVVTPPGGVSQATCRATARATRLRSFRTLPSSWGKFMAACPTKVPRILSVSSGRRPAVRGRRSGQAGSAAGSSCSACPPSCWASAPPSPAGPTGRSSPAADRRSRRGRRLGRPDGRWRHRDADHTDGVLVRSVPVLLPPTASAAPTLSRSRRRPPTRRPSRRWREAETAEQAPSRRRLADRLLDDGATQAAVAAAAAHGPGRAGRRRGQGPRAEDRLRPGHVRLGLGGHRPQRLRHPQRHPARDLTGETFKPGTHGCVVLTGTLPTRTPAARSPSCAAGTSRRRADRPRGRAVRRLAEGRAAAGRRHAATAFANDPLNLLAVDGPLNMPKGDGDAATWLPPASPTAARTSPGRWR